MPGPFASYLGARCSLQSPAPAPGCYYKCEEFVHMRRQCPRLVGGPSLQRSQSMSSASVPPPPAQSARGHTRGGDRSEGGQACFCALPARLDAIASDVVITGIISVCHRDASVLFGHGSTYSYVFSYFAHSLDMPRESLVLSVHVSTPAGDTIILDRVYRSCVVTIGALVARVDLLLLSMVDFDVILGMDWLSPCHTILDCHAKLVTLAMPDLPRVMWNGSIDYVPSRVITYLKAQRMVEKGCISYLSFVMDVSAETPAIDSILVVRDFPDVFPADLPGMPPDRDIDFGIDLVPCTQPISILPYHMAPAKLKELKEQL
ncbi:uncharacterized protein [Nicotiana tomentosiformis]|uniref:uncharacterized protein n=1 Tax=Nicotiana tomentosiformis TaxID=4098 RepID=UPI00388C784C